MDIFLACVSLTMFLNAVLLFFIYRTMSAAASKAMEKVSELETNGQVRQVLAAMESNSAEAARITGVVKEQMAVLSKSLERAETAYGKGLSASDAAFSVAFRAIHFTAAATQKVVTFPVKNVLLVTSVLQRVIGFIRRHESGVGAMPRQNR
jgi:hypothetical protein